MADGDARIHTIERERALIWDLPVRVFHWALVLAMVAAFITHRLGPQYFKFHAWSGYAVLVLVAFRIVWGIVGTRHARFIHFVRGPKTIARYMRGREQYFPGHNPLGALMVVALLLALLVQSVTGLFGNDEIFNVGPLYGYVDNELSLRLTSLHQQLFYWIAAAVALHILAVIVYRIFKKEKLVEAMLTGRKDGIVAGHAIASSRLGWAILILVVLVLLLASLIAGAPIPVTDTGY
jgi:cytochrome b